MASEHIAWTTVSFALRGTISETRGLLRVGLGSVAFSAVDIRDIFVGLEALVALRGEGWPGLAGGHGWPPAAYDVIDGSDLYDVSCSLNPLTALPQRRRGDRTVSA